MTIQTPDNDWNHLYPAFRERLRQVFAEAKAATGVAWVMTEGLRIPERQLWLYAQGRTRPGKIVTWQKVPYHHGTGLAADCYPEKLLWNAPQKHFEAFRAVYLKHGLTNPAWTKGDRGHCQLSDPVIRAKALAWVRAGCPQKEPIYPDPTLHVLVDGHEIPDAAAFLQDDKTYVALRPVADALDYSIVSVSQNDKGWTAHLTSDAMDETVPIRIKGNTGFVQITDLPVPVHYEATTKTMIVGGK